MTNSGEVAVRDFFHHPLGPRRIVGTLAGPQKYRVALDWRDLGGDEIEPDAIVPSRPVDDDHPASGHLLEMPGGVRHGTDMLGWDWDKVGELCEKKVI